MFPHLRCTKDRLWHKSLWVWHVETKTDHEECPSATCTLHFASMNMHQQLGSSEGTSDDS